MSARWILAAVGFVFVVVGGLLLVVVSRDPAPREKLATIAGRLATVEFDETAKLGRVCRFRIEASEAEYAIDHLEQIPAVSRRLEACLQRGVAVEVKCVPRERFAASGWAPARSVPQSALMLAVGGDLVLDQARDRPSGIGSTTAVFAGGLLAMVLGVLLVLPSLRARRST
jgi:hypothetical protein